MCISPPRLISMITLSVLSVFGISLSHAQLPATRLGAVFPSGGGPGDTFDVTIYGDDLDDVDRLLFSHPKITAEPKMAEPGPFDEEPQRVENQFTVSVADDVPIGSYEVRAIGKYGASNPRIFAVDDLPAVVETEPNDDHETATEVLLPAIVHGQSNQTADVDYFRFTAPAGQRVLVSSLAQTVDTRFNAAIALHDASGRLVGSSAAAQGRDALIDFVTPRAGEYLLKVHDSSYQGSGEHVYRLSIGSLPHIDYVFPPAGQPGGNRPFTVYGRNLPGGKPSEFMLDGQRLESVDVNIAIPNGSNAQTMPVKPNLAPASAALDAFEYRIKGPQGSSQSVLVGIATATPVQEAAGNDSPATAQSLTLPCEVMGQCYPQRDRDWYSFEAKEGEMISIEIISQRLGLPTNPCLLVQRVTPAAGEEPEQVEQITYQAETASSQEGGPEFDLRHNDVEYRFSAPADGLYRLMVRDAYADVSPDPRRTYRLAVRTGTGDFRLAAVPEQSASGVLLRKGGQAGIRVIAFRRDGFDEAIRVTATGLPAGVTCSDAIIGPGSNVGMLVLSAAGNAAAATTKVQVIGEAEVDGAELTRQARFGAAISPTNPRQNPNQNIPAVDGRLTHDLWVSVSDAEEGLVSLQAGEGKVWETSRAGKLTIPVTRSGPFKGQISLMGRGLPGVNFPVTNIPANQPKGEVAVTLTRTIPPGLYTFYLDGIAQQVDYTRNPEAAEAAAQRQKEVDAIKAKADADAVAAATAKTAADKLAAETDAAVTKATAEKTAAEKTLAEANAAAEKAAAESERAVADAAANKDDASAAAAQNAAQNAAEDAAKKLTIATSELEAAEKTLEDAMVKAEEATDAKGKADAEDTEAKRLAQLAAELKRETDQKAVALANAAKPKKVNVPVVSTPITVKIAAAPVTLAELAPVTVKQGEQAEVPVAMTRLFDYQGQVNFNTVLPPGVAGLSIPNVAIPANQSQAKLMVTTAAEATEGEHQLTVRGTLNLNGQNLTVEQPLRLTVQKAPPANE